jgi:hypothetical protein
LPGRPRGRPWHQRTPEISENAPHWPRSCKAKLARVEAFAPCGRADYTPCFCALAHAPRTRQEPQKPGFWSPDVKSCPQGARTPPRGKQRPGRGLLSAHASGKLETMSRKICLTGSFFFDPPASGLGGASLRSKWQPCRRPPNARREKNAMSRGLILPSWPMGGSTRLDANRLACGHRRPLALSTACPAAHSRRPAPQVTRLEMQQRLPWNSSLSPREAREMRESLAQPPRFFARIDSRPEMMLSTLAEKESHSSRFSLSPACLPVIFLHSVPSPPFTCSPAARS